MIAITPEQHSALLGTTYSRPKLRALLGPLTEAEYFEIKRRYLVLRRESGWIAPAPKRRRNRRQVAA